MSNQYPPPGPPGPEGSDPHDPHDSGDRSGQPGQYGQPYGSQQGQPGQSGQYGQPYGDQQGQPGQYGQQGGYGQPDPYGQPGQYGAPPPYAGGGYGGGFAEPKVSPLAIVSLVTGILGICGCGVFLFGIAGVVTGVIARKQINESQGQLKGSGLALAGLIVGAVGIVLGLVYWILIAAGGVDFSTSP